MSSLPARAESEAGDRRSKPAESRHLCAIKPSRHLTPARAGCFIQRSWRQAGPRLTTTKLLMTRIELQARRSGNHTLACSRHCIILASVQPDVGTSQAHQIRAKALLRANADSPMAPSLPL